MHKERPILFSGPMVRAILEGRKTQTRRIIKPQPRILGGDEAPTGLLGIHNGEARFGYGDVITQRIKCRYGKPGDRLWVREAAWTHPILGVHTYKADATEWPPNGGHSSGKSTPSIHMRREDSRILLEVTAIRVERLQDISEEDAIAEGLFNEPIRGDAWGWEPFKTDLKTLWTNRWNTPQNAYRALWESINGKGSWDANPWVWVVEFKRVESEVAR